MRIELATLNNCKNTLKSIIKYITFYYKSNIKFIHKSLKPGRKIFPNFSDPLKPRHLWHYFQKLSADMGRKNCKGRVFSSAGISRTDRQTDRNPHRLADIFSPHTPFTTNSKRPLI